MRKLVINIGFIALSVTLASCLGSSVKKENNNTEKIKSTTQIIEYEKFTPQEIKNLEVKNINDIREAYQVGNKKVVIASSVNNDNRVYGPFLSLLDKNNNVEYVDKNGGEFFIFKPHFYKNKQNDKIIIICQAGYEYPCCSEVYILEKGKIARIGTLDIEPMIEDKYITEVTKIIEEKGEIIFTFDEENLILEPGGENQINIKNTKTTRYVYKNGKLNFHR